MVPRNTFSFETLLHLLILLLALFLRSADLGEPPLTELEAQNALAARSLANGGSSELGDQPGYVLLASPVFSLLGSNEFVARFLPAIFGLALVALPYFWRDLLGQKAALLLSFALALDPGMVAVSRLASGHMIAVGAGFMALTAWRHSSPIAAGILASIALLASPVIFMGLVPAVLVLLTIQSKPKWGSQQLGRFFMALVIALILGGTLFLRAPEGLAGLGSTVASFLGGFTQSGTPITEVGLALLGYTLPAAILGLLGAVNAWRNDHSVGRVVSLFALFSLLLILVYPGRQVADLLWVIVALWTLAATQVARYVSLPRKDIGVAIGESGLILLLGIFFGIALTKIASNYSGFVFVAIFTLGLAVLATILIAFGWSRVGAEYGVAWALLLFSALFMLSASSRFLRVESTDANDLWSPGPAAGSSRALAESLHELSVLEQGQANELAVDLRSDSAVLNWELRNLPVADLSAEKPPPLVVMAAADAQAGEFAEYRGQSFAAWVQRAWQGWPPNFFAWLFYRQAPIQTAQIVLWAKEDLFPDAQIQSSTSPEANP